MHDFLDDYLSKRFKNKRLGRYVDSYLPFYDEYSDYNTNAKSYYDYLARYNKMLRVYYDFINKLLKRDIEFKDTDSIDFKKLVSWVDGDDLNDLMEVEANVNLAKYHYEPIDLLDGEFMMVGNAIKLIEDNGLYAPDYFEVMQRIIRYMEEVLGKVDEIDWDLILNIEGRLEDLEDQVKDNKDRLDSIQGLELKDLVKGVDYEISFYNGFYSPQDDLIVQIGETSDTIDIHVTTNSTEGYVLKHDGDLRKETRLSLRPEADYPEKSDVFSIKLIGEYAQYQNENVAVDNTKPVLWHISPVEARASWDVLLTVHNIRRQFRYSWRQISDGYGDQLEWTYSDPLSLNWGNVDSEITIFKEVGK